MSAMSLQARRAMLVAQRDIYDEGGGVTYHVHDGAQPATPEDAPPNSPIAIVSTTAPSFSLHATDASMTLTAVGNAARAGAPTWVRVVNGNGQTMADYSAGLPGSGAEIEITNGQTPAALQMYTGGEITITHTIARGS